MIGVGPTEDRPGVATEESCSNAPSSQVSRSNSFQKLGLVRWLYARGCEEFTIQELTDSLFVADLSLLERSLNELVGDRSGRMQRGPVPNGSQPGGRLLHGVPERNIQGPVGETGLAR